MNVEVVVSNRQNRRDKLWAARLVKPEKGEERKRRRRKRRRRKSRRRRRNNRGTK